MKNHLRLLLIILTLIAGSLVACDEEAYLEDEPVEAEEVVAEPQPAEESEPAADPAARGVSGEAIPLECLADEDAFYECWDNGLIPEDCIDDEEYIKDECLPSEYIGESAVEEDEESGQSEDPQAEPEQVTREDAPVANGQSASVAGLTDSGFRPEEHGFNFWNYGNEYGSLTPAELQRMFGNSVCASMASGDCILTPPANQWMEQMNEYMDGGHCEGMAVLSSLMYYDQVSPQNFGGDVAHDLDINNQGLQQEIAYWWVTQGTYPGGFNKVSESPTAVVNALIETFSQGKSAPEWWAMGIYKSDYSGGHAITPFAVEDKGGGNYYIWVYDNNFPDETRYVEVDTNTDTWKYQASTHPDVPEELYDGDAELQNLEVVAISPRLEPQQCDFCAEGGTTGQTDSTRTAGLAKPEPQYYQIWLSGKADLLIIDDQDRRIGYDNGVFVNEIPGATGENFKFAGMDVWATDNEPVYRVPAGLSFEILIDGTRLEQAEDSAVSMIGPGYYMAVEDIWLEPGEIDSIAVTTDGPRRQLTYFTDYAESPMIELGMETPAADYAFLVQATEMLGQEDAFDVGIDLEEGDFIINTSYNTEPVTFDVYVLRIDDEGEFVFGSDGVVMEPENTLYLNYLEWVEDGTVMYADFDYDNDGEIDESIELPDEADAWFEEE